MNLHSENAVMTGRRIERRPILIVPYMWIGDFVRCHSVVRLLKAQDPDRPVDVLTTANAAPLLDYMPGVRKGIICDLPRRRLAFSQHRALAERLHPEGYGQALVMPRTWKSALAPFLAHIPIRTGFLGEVRIGVINDLRHGERQLPRMIDQCAALALPKGMALPADWPLPELIVPPPEIAAWRQRWGLPVSGRRAIAIAPGAVGPSKRWPSSSYAQFTAKLGAEGIDTWVLGSPAEKTLAAEIAANNPNVRDMTGPDIRNAIVALAAADAVVSNDSGLLHVAAALETPSLGIFGPTSPELWAPLNPLAAVIQADIELDCRPCHKPICRLQHHLCMREIAVAKVVALTLNALSSRTSAPRGRPVFPVNAVPIIAADGPFL